MGLAFAGPGMVDTDWLPWSHVWQKPDTLKILNPKPYGLSGPGPFSLLNVNPGPGSSGNTI